MDLNPIRGREQAGKRPALVVSTNGFNKCPADLMVVVPITRKDKSIPWHVPCNHPAGSETASQQRLNELIREAERAAAGLVDPFADQRKRSLTDHVADFRQHLESKGGSTQHVSMTVSRIESTFAGCGFKLLGQLDSDKVSNWLKQRRDESNDTQNREANAAKLKPFGIASSNHHLVAVKSFGNWLVRSRRLERNPFAHLSRLNAKVDVRVERRALDSAELSRLIEATEHSATTFRGLSGPDRSALYVMAAMTGLRANELASLTALSFDFHANPPTVKVEAASEKAGRGATLPLHPFAADKVSKLLASRQRASVTPKIKLPAESLWPGTWSTRAAEMFRRDLDKSRSIWLAEVEKIAEELQQRTDSSFLKPQNANGEIADFHALRHTFITMLASSGVHPKVAQQLARHSTITLTMDRYSHARLVDLNSAVENLPSLASPPKPELAEIAVETTNHTSGSADVLVARLVARPADEQGLVLITADEPPAYISLAPETQLPLKNRRIDGACDRLRTIDEIGTAETRTPNQRIMSRFPDVVQRLTMLRLVAFSDFQLHRKLHSRRRKTVANG